MSCSELEVNHAWPRGMGRASINRYGGTDRGLAAAAVLLALAACHGTGGEEVVLGKTVAQWTVDLGSPSAEVRLKAANTLAAAGERATSAVPDLARALGDDSTAVRSAAAGALRQMPDAAPGELKRLLAREEDGSVRAWAHLALLELGVDEKRHLGALKALLSDPHWSARAQAAAALAEAGEAARETTPALAKALGTETHPEARRALTEALARVGPPNAAP